MPWRLIEIPDADATPADLTDAELVSLHVNAAMVLNRKSGKGEHLTPADAAHDEHYGAYLKLTRQYRTANDRE